MNNISRSNSIIANGMKKVHNFQTEEAYDNNKNKWKSFFKKKEKPKNPEEEEQPKPVPISVLFRYATVKEKLLMVLGILIAIITGMSFPAMVIFFGNLTNAFVQTGIGLNSTDIVRPNSTIEICPNPIELVDPYEVIRNFGIWVSVIATLVLILGYLFVTILVYTAEAQANRIRNLLLESIMRQEIGWFDTAKSNNFASRVTDDLNKLQDGIGDKIGLFMFFFSTFFFSIINAFWHGWELTLVILSVFPILGISTGLLAKIQSTLTTLELEKYAKAGSVAEEVLSSIRTVVAFAGEDKEVKRYEKNLVDAKDAGIRRGLMTGIGMGTMWFIIFSSYSLAFWYGIKLITESNYFCNPDDYDPQDLIVVFFSVLMGAMNVGTASPYMEAFQIARGAAATLYDIIERESAIDPTSITGKKLQRIDGNIEFKDVFFNYPSRPDVKILQGLNLKINSGQTVALVGQSGCGKSTCIQLIQRFYDPIYGSVKLDGINVRELNTGWLRDNIGIVGQEPVLFAYTIEENIKLANPKATYRDVIEAAKEANAHDFIMKLPRQYDTFVGERGVQISGGQKQRIAIARALITQPKVLLLDEATSALDNKSEAIVQKALDKARKGRTTIIVAHRLSTIRSADVIVAMEHGVVKEIGTHEQLMNNDDLYKSLVTAQLNPLKQEDKVEDDEIVLMRDISSDEDSDIEQGRRKSSMKLSLRRKSSKKSTKKKKGLRKFLNAKDDDSVDVKLMDILELQKSEWKYIFFGLSAAVVQGAVMPTYAILFGNVMGTLSNANRDEIQEEANMYCVYFLILGIVAGLSILVQTAMFSISGEILTLKLRKMAFKAMMSQEMGWFDNEKNSVGALCSKLSGEASAVQGASGSRMGTIIQSMVAVVLSITVAMVYNWKLGLVTLPFTPIILLGMYYGARLQMGQTTSESQIYTDAGKTAIEAISNIRTVASLHKEQHFIESYKNACVVPHKKALKLSHIKGFIFGFAQSTPMYAYAGVMFYGGHLIKVDGEDYQDVFKVGTALILGTMSVGQAVAFSSNLGSARVAAGKIFALLRRVPEIDGSPSSGLRMPKNVSNIELKDVHFAYPSRPTIPILRGLNVEINKGDSVALVGSSGCGKSTIINLLERFYNAKSGIVDLNGTNIEALNVSCTRGMFGLVSQEPVLFDRTIGENISYGDNSKTFSYDEIESVAKQANVHRFIMELPEGYDTPVGAKGAQLSGGQKQRIAIARALIRKPTVLLLDEATSALDSESEKIVQATLEEVQQGITSITIAHRLSTIKNANKIIVVKGGKVVEQGTHDELMMKKGNYFNLYQSNV